LPDIDREISSFEHIETGIAEVLSDNEHKAYVLYNKAIDDIRSGNEDIAFIKLKKAVSAKPDLYDARLLIGLYHAKLGNDAKALDIFEDIIRNNEARGAEALRYIRMLNADREAVAVAAPKKTDNKEKNTKTFKYAKQFFGAIIGVVICIPVIMLVNKGQPSDGDKEVISSQEQMISELSEEISSLEDMAASLENEVEELREAALEEETSYELSQEEKDQIALEAIDDYKTDLGTYLGIIELFNNGEYLEAADGIMDFKDANQVFAEMLGVRFTSFYKEAVDKAARYCEDRGVELYDAMKYDESLDMLEKAAVYDPDYQRMYRVTYYIGKDLLAKGEYDAAKAKFLEVIQIAPNDDWVTYANIKLREISELTKTD
jgi:tetratricopeptide (TPR) repeat protein